ncbi:hypothetical protein ACGFYZ_33395 [Streptomyces sp. NPDC048330]|uniref:hypothetical protein n=1 Tax=Streptomyces sp. NPDC048330 TaxID=3365533 RepID=UPI003722BA12
MTSLLNKEEVCLAFEQFPGLEMHDRCAPWSILGIDEPRPGPAGAKGVQDTRRRVVLGLLNEAR